MTTLDHHGAHAPVLPSPPVRGLPAWLRHAVTTAATIGGRTRRVLGVAFRGLVVGLVAAYLGAMAASGGAAHLGLHGLEVPIAFLIGCAVLALATLPLVAVRVTWRAAVRAPWTRSGPNAVRVPRFLRLVALTITAALRIADPWLIGPVLALVGLSVLVPNEGPGMLLKPSSATLPFVAATALAAALVALARLGLRGARVSRSPSGRTGRRLGAAAAGAGAALIGVGSVGAVLDPGSATHLVAPDPAYTGSGTAIQLPDPGMPGAFAVRETAYGSGTDRHRPVFGPGVPVRTPTIDASAALAMPDGVAGEGRRWFWGFDFSALPLNALVWEPVGDGPFPLALVVHGNHDMGEFSESGYAYLGRHLASHGMLVASVDENFLNGGAFGDLDGREMPIRAWMLLRHLALWRDWTADPGSPFHGRVDLDRVALIGHSRGGEAAGHAAALAELDAPPATLPLDWPAGLAVRAVVAIAPSDGMYARGNDRVDGVDFLTITGGHDADAVAWSGMREYGRTTVEGDDFKAAVWIQRANHGQFNTVWGWSDQGSTGAWLINRRALLEGEAQRRAGLVFITAFLRASLADDTGYRELFRMPAAGRDWLPDDVYLVRSADGRSATLLNPDGKSVERAVPVTYEGFSATRPTDVPLRALQRTQINEAILLRWETGAGAATVRVGVDGALGETLTETSRLTFALASAMPWDSGVALDPLVTLETADGLRVGLPLRTWGILPPPMRADMLKHDAITSLLGIGVPMNSAVERVLQTWAVPLADFVAAEPALNPSRIRSLTLSFDRAQGGAAYLDEVGFAPD